MSENTPTPTQETTTEEQRLTAWCKEYAPELPTRFASVVSEWSLNDKEASFVVYLLLNHVRHSTTAQP